MAENHKIACNLPLPEQSSIIGRHQEIAYLLDLLSPRYAAHLISVDGIGGVGKTALVLEVAYRCLRASTGETSHAQFPIPTFDAIIFASAKQQYLTPNGIQLRSDAQRTLRHIFRAIALTLNRIDITEATPEDQYARVRDALSHQRTLLIVDNLETMEDKQGVMSFLYRLPPSVKAVITSREQAIFSPIRLEQMSEEESVDLILKEACEKGVGTKLDKQQALLLYRCIGGIPAALTYVVGQLAAGYSLEAVLGGMPQAGSDVSSFCFDASISPLRKSPAHQLLMALAMFPRRPLLAAIASAAGLANNPSVVEEGLAQLERLSLANPHGDRYRMLPLTREYALAELTANPQFEREARTRWVEWYLDYTMKNGGGDWSGWQEKYDRVEEEWENLLAVFDWCAAHGQYDAIRAFWQERRVLGVADIYGFWADRLAWLGWLIEEAEKREDWSAAMEARGDRGFTLTLMDELEEAEDLLNQAWSFYEMADLNVQIEVAQEFSLLRIYQERFADAIALLQHAQFLLERPSLDELERTRLGILTQFYTGFMHYRKHDYARATSCFKEMVAKAREIEWQRYVIYAQNFLANIAIADGKLEEAESLLRAGLMFSESSKDKRRTAHYQYSLARLEKTQGNINEAHSWIQAALDGFERLGMRRETRIIHEHWQL